MFLSPQFEPAIVNSVIFNHKINNFRTDGGDQKIYKNI